MTPEEIATKIFGCVSSDGTYLEFRDVEAANIIREAIRLAYEDAARIAEQEAKGYDDEFNSIWACEAIAAAIRARKEEA
jgi:hypothetical protein